MEKCMFTVAALFSLQLSAAVSDFTRTVVSTKLNGWKSVGTLHPAKRP